MKSMAHRLLERINRVNKKTHLFCEANAEFETPANLAHSQDEDDWLSKMEKLRNITRVKAEDLPLISSMYNIFKRELSKSGSLYPDEKKDFYRKYIEFANKCKELRKTISTSGYGPNGLAFVKLRNIFQNIDMTFPYGWK